MAGTGNEALQTQLEQKIDIPTSLSNKSDNGALLASNGGGLSDDTHDKVEVKSQFKSVDAGDEKRGSANNNSNAADSEIKTDSSAGLASVTSGDDEDGNSGNSRRTRYERYKDWHKRWFHKGNVANIISLVIMIIGLIMNWTIGDGDATRYVLSIGLFGFSGGITNWLAVKMLFDRVPFLYGSGVIPRRFKEIRTTVKDTIMKSFFDEEYLRSYITEKIKDFDIDKRINDMMSSPKTDKIIDEKLNAALSRPEVSMMMMMMGINMQPAMLAPMLKPFVLTLGKEIGPLLKDELFGEDSSLMNVARVREEIDALMESRLQLLTAPMVKELMEDVMRKHLAWLIIWGNVFGALIGFLSAIAHIPS